MSNLNYGVFLVVIQVGSAIASKNTAKPIIDK
jgi:hypothetical protein